MKTLGIGSENRFRPCAGTFRNLPEIGIANPNWCRRLHLSIAPRADTWQDEQEAKRQAIEEAANAKRREAAKEQENRGNRYTQPKQVLEVVVPKEQAPLKTEQREEDRAPGRSERAKAANVSIEPKQVDEPGESP